MGRRLLTPLFHFGTLPLDSWRRRWTFLWISSGYDHTRKCPYLNVTMLGRYTGRLYARNDYKGRLA